MMGAHTLAASGDADDSGSWECRLRFTSVMMHVGSCVLCGKSFYPLERLACRYPLETRAVTTTTNSPIATAEREDIM